MTILLLLMAIFHSASASALDEDLQCVPYARALTGIEIRGDAHTWWDQAKGRYKRGQQPRVGAVMSFRPYGAMELGHVAAVRQIIDSRTVIISHANWSTIGGKRGHIEENVKAIDASEAGDWSRVQIWYTPNNAMGSTQWPLNGFIYPDTKRSDSQARLALAQIIGPKSRITPVPLGRSEVRIASNSNAPNSNAPNSNAPNSNAPAKTQRSFQLSSRTLAEVGNKAASEKRTAAAKPVSALKDEIGDLIGLLGS